MPVKGPYKAHSPRGSSIYHASAIFKAFKEEIPSMYHIPAPQSNQQGPKYLSYGPFTSNVSRN